MIELPPGVARLRVTIANTGARPAEEVMQVYITPPSGTPDAPLASSFVTPGRCR